MWSDPSAMEAVFQLIPSLPYVKEMMLALFRGALVIFIRFPADCASSLDKSLIVTGLMHNRRQGK
jgi:hypothetical protein